MNCPNCDKRIVAEWGGFIFKNVVQYYPEILYECECGVIVNENGEEKTEEYYKYNHR